MGSITLILGGARSGKSDYAQELALKLNKKTLFLATAIPFDKGMEYRIKRHQQSRPNSWKTIEQYNGFNSLTKNSDFTKSDVILLDCITLFVTNNMLDSGINWEYTRPEEVNAIEDKISNELDDLFKVCKDKELIIVSNEVGLGVVPATNLANYFRDIMGRINKLIARKSNKVIFMIAGIPKIIKED